MHKIQMSFLDNVGSPFKLPIRMTFPASYPSFDSDDVFNDDPLRMHDSSVENRNIFSSLLSAYYLSIYKYFM